MTPRSDTNAVGDAPKTKGYMREWSCITLPPDDAIWVGKRGVSQKGRDFINGLFDRIIELEEENKKLKEVA